MVKNEEFLPNKSLCVIAQEIEYIFSSTLHSYYGLYYEYEDCTAISHGHDHK
jgi:hypothetical protein